MEADLYLLPAPRSHEGRPDEERPFRNRPQGFCSNDDDETLDAGITLLMPLLIATRACTTAKPLDDDVVIAVENIETYYDQENNNNAKKTTVGRILLCGTTDGHHRTLFRTWRKDVLWAISTFRQILQNSSDHSILHLILLIGAPWMVPVIIITIAFCVPWVEDAGDGATITTTTISIVTATAWHCQVSWIRYAMLVAPLVTMEENNHIAMMTMTREQHNTDSKLPCLSLRRNRRILGCSLATAMVNLPTFLWIMFGDDNYDTPVWAGIGAVVIIFLAKSLTFTRVRGGVKNALSICILLSLSLSLPFFVAYLLCAISAMLKSLEDYYSEYHLQQSSESVIDAELARLHQQSAAMSYFGDPVTLSETRTNAHRRARAMMMYVMMWIIAIYFFIFALCALINYELTPSLY